VCSKRLCDSGLLANQQNRHKLSRKDSFTAAGGVGIVPGMSSPLLDRPLNVLGITGSPTPSSRSTALMRAALASLAPAAGAVNEIDVRSLPAPALLHADFAHPLIVDALAQVAAADLVLVATPIYKAAYSGLLKSFLDLLPQDGLRGKTVLPLATGGSTAHLLALDYALKPVLGALGARHILDSVYATDAQFDTDPVLGRRPQAEVLERLARALAPLEAPASRLAAAEHLRRAHPTARMPC